MAVRGRVEFAILRTSSQRTLGSILILILILIYAQGSKVKMGPSVRWDDDVGVEDDVVLWVSRLRRVESTSRTGLVLGASGAPAALGKDSGWARIVDSSKPKLVRSQSRNPFIGASNRELHRSKR